MASVRKLTTPNREGKFPWVVEYTDASGKRRRATPKSGLKKDADALRRKIEEELDHGTHVAASQSTTLADAAERWLNDCERRHRIDDKMAGGTLAKYRGSVRAHILPALGQHRLPELTFAVLQSFVNAKAETLMAGTVDNICVALKQVLKFAVAQNTLVLSPLTGRALRVPNRRPTRKKIPSKDEMRRILEAACRREPREQRAAFRATLALVLLSTFAGLRRGEICALQWENIDFEADELHVRHSQSHYDGLKGPKSAAGNRTVPLAPQVSAFLRALHVECGPAPTGYVLLNAKGRPFEVNALWFNFVRLLKKAGLTDPVDKPLYTLHALRHFNVSILASVGLQPFNIKTLVGHSSIAMTMDVYGHMFRDDGTSRKAIHASAALLDPGRLIPPLTARHP